MPSPCILCATAKAHFDQGPTFDIDHAWTIASSRTACTRVTRMTIGSTLEIRQTYRLAMTPQLRQAIGMLRLNNSELRAHLKAQIGTNPLIEIRQADGGGENRAPARGGSGSLGAGDAGMALTNAPAAADSLQSSILQQIQLAIRDPRRQTIAIAFLDALEPYGWLGRELEAIADECDCSFEDAEAVLAVLQGFEPSGIFARSLKECLSLQARDEGPLDPIMETVLGRLDLVAAGDLAPLAEVCGCDVEAIELRLRRLRGFDPKPGARFQEDGLPPRGPDLTLERVSGAWQVKMNSSTLPMVVVSQDAAWDQDVRQLYLAEAQTIASGLMRAVELRNANTLSVAAEIVRRQTMYLSRASEALVPLTRKDVAEAVSLHESTVSRVTSGMTIDTPRGVLELAKLFCRGLAAPGDAEAVSVDAVQDRIAAMIRAEPAGRPLSDELITTLLRKEKIEIQRRTVAKYRGLLGIPSSSVRRRAASKNPDA
ncbi:MAG: RNA polymerase factor sigma-54 [Rhodobacteraceae bacterium]|nr:RNA polymerase factor sigma-54 [Paracoccaceae bacterium]